MIFLIDGTKASAVTYSEIFYFMGVLNRSEQMGRAERVPEPKNERYTAALVIRPEQFDSPERIPASLKRENPFLPVFALSGNSSLCGCGFDGIFPIAVSSASLLMKMQKYNAAHGLSVPGCYRLAGIDASVDLSEATYFDRPIGLTKTETMILRSLIRSYPLPKSAKEIMKTAYRPSRIPELSNIRTHVSVINRKFRQITGRALIGQAENGGYTVLTPDIMERKQEREPASL